MPISWAAALRLYGKQKGAFIVPKKGSADYEAIKKLQGETADGPEHAVKKRQSKKILANVSETMPSVEGSTIDGIVDGKVVGKRAPTGRGGASRTTTRNHDPIVPPAVDTKIIDPQDKEGQKKKRVVNAAKIADRKKVKGIETSGVTEKEEVVDFIANKNVGMSSAISAQSGVQKDELKKALKQAKATPKVVSVREGEEETIDNMTTDDKPAIEGRQPFSIQALRNKLLC